MTATVTGRVLGWDVLRGLCALAVAAYHLLYWQGIAALHTFGSYGVYLFFVLSGASLAYNYQHRLNSVGEAVRFLAMRWLRLAPLYLLACILVAAWLIAHPGPWSEGLPLRFVLNATFAFGVRDPTLWALPIGGWSVGIEFVYYLAFPLLLPLLSRRAWWIAAGLALSALQWFWIQRTAGAPSGYAENTVAYHQVPAFAAYFFGGCVIGAARRAENPGWPQSLGVVTWLALAVLLLALNPLSMGSELLGARGAVLFCACFAAVFASGQVTVGPRLAAVARWLGDVTYGCYLLHPLFFFGFAWSVWPSLTTMKIGDAPLPLRVAVLAGVLVTACLAATASERWFEAPLRRWGKRVLQRPSGPYIDAASISS